jgi:hypothetical protein
MIKLWFSRLRRILGFAAVLYIFYTFLKDVEFDGISILFVFLAVDCIFYEVSQFNSKYKRIEGLNYKKERKILIFYNALIVVVLSAAYIPSLEPFSGLIIFFLLIPIMALHCGAISFSFLIHRKANFKTFLMTLFTVIGFNILMFLVDILAMGLIARIWYGVIGLIR